MFSSFQNALIVQLERKLEALQIRKTHIETSKRANDKIGQSIKTVVEAKAEAPREISKFTRHIEDIDKITSLMFGLSGRLARVEHEIAVAEAAEGNDRFTDKVLLCNQLVRFRKFLCQFIFCRSS